MHRLDLLLIVYPSTTDTIWIAAIRLIELEIKLTLNYLQNTESKLNEI